MLNDALKLALRGFPVFPLLPRSKEPACPHGVKEATTDSNQIRRWWLQNPNYNIGLALGKTSGVVCLDIDYNNGADESYLNTLPVTMTARSANGHHAYFKYSDGIKNRLIIPGSTSGKASVYLRSDGYYMVAPPSIHPSGAEYRWEDHLGYPDGGLSPWNAEAQAIPPLLLGQEPAKPVGPSQYGPGARHDALLRTATARRAAGDEAQAISEELHRRNLEDFNPPKLGAEVDKEIAGIVRWVIKNIEPKPQDKVAKDGTVKPGKLIASNLAYQFLMDTGLANDVETKLRYYQGTYYVYDQNHYREVPEDEIRSNLTVWLRDSGHKSVAGSQFCNGILTCIKVPPIFTKADTEPPCVLDEAGTTPAKHLVPLQNGLLDMREFSKQGGKVMSLLPHAPDFFCTYVLPYSYDPAARCPLYEEIALTTFGSPERKALWEEIMGIHLFQPFPLEHFFILQGEGANGKSVLVNILRSLLGHENVSSVPLECFRSDNFSLHNTLGKLANIISDQHEIENVNEGFLKQFVSREPMTFNRKFKDAITAAPTAFLTVCTNTVPRFADKSDGIWRRMVLFQLHNQVESEKQDPRLLSRGFWAESGELPGILNLALAGLQRVIARSYLAKLECMKTDALVYRESLDNVAQFANECCDFNAALKSPSSELYQSYRRMTQSNGERPVSAKNFAHRFKLYCQKLGHIVEMSKTNERILNYAGRVWHGTALNDIGQVHKVNIPYSQLPTDCEQRSQIDSLLLSKKPH